MPSTRKRGRSPSADAPAPAAAAACRTTEEWETLENGSVLMLPPTAAIVRGVLHTSQDDAAAAVVKIAAFDMDDTVIKTASGAVFAKDDPTDWQWVHEEVPRHLQHLHDHGFLIVLFSNQLGIGKGSSWSTAKAEAIKAKVVLLSRAASVPLCACVATRDDRWRKPSPRMWGLMAARITQCAQEESRECGGDGGMVSVDCDAYSFYVGDAAGRPTPTMTGRKKDFSCSDRHFAYNLQLPFLTPEQVFTTAAESLLQEDTATQRQNLPVSSAATAEPQARLSFRLSTAMLRLSAAASDAPPAPDFSWGDVGPAELAALPRSYAGLSVQVITAAAAGTTTLPPAAPFFVPASARQQEMILFIGYPGCGKSSFFRRHLQPYNYHSVNRDTLQTRAKCLRAAEEHWVAGHSVVVDNTSPTADDRQAYIDLVKKHVERRKGTAASPLPVRIFFFTHTRGVAQHMNVVRSNVEGVARVPTIAYNVFHARLQRPTTPAEVAALGIDSVWEIPVVACFDGAPTETERTFNLLL